ncbi:hypothetical protein Y032_0044g974 [Ancylostoma ceylanicum]|uniref:Uncharacterized protein n=1 Tax=Ancylostoma ceylanicum TaxID=53326 RepID=A0A016UEX2_9BILA|nr:hypothetical protein Y032_0044g974 [Ancylostoma ceylanicum]
MSWQLDDSSSTPDIRLRGTISGSNKPNSPRIELLECLSCPNDTTVRGATWRSRWAKTLDCCYRRFRNESVLAHSYVEGTTVNLTNRARSTC